MFRTHLQNYQPSLKKSYGEYTKGLNKVYFDSVIPCRRILKEPMIDTQRDFHMTDFHV